jgi:hypothetical protein
MREEAKEPQLAPASAQPEISEEIETVFSQSTKFSSESKLKKRSMQ